AEETGECRDLTLWVRVAVAAKNSKIPLERKYGVAGAKAVRLLGKARQAAKTLGVTFHVGSQTATPDAFVSALAEIGKLIVKAGVVLDRLDVGGGFPSIYSDDAPAPLSAFVRAITDCVDRLPVGEHCRLMCEPGRALVAEAESLIVRVDARRGNELYINDGSYGRCLTRRTWALPSPFASLVAGWSLARRWHLLPFGAPRVTRSTTCPGRSSCPPRSRRVTTSRLAIRGPMVALSVAASTATAATMR